MKKFRQQSSDSRKVKPSYNNGIRAEDIKNCDLATKETMETDLPRSVKARKMYCRNIAQNTDKSYPQKEGTKKCRKLSPDLYFASAVQNCFRLSCTTDFIPDVIKFNPKIGRVPALLPSDLSHSNLRDD